MPRIDLVERHHGIRGAGWCEYGSPTELPHIVHRSDYDRGVTLVPDYGLTCFFIDRDYGRTGVAVIALRGALDLIARAGGGLVEASPALPPGRRIASSSLDNVTRAMFTPRASPTAGPRAGTTA